MKKYKIAVFSILILLILTVVYIFAYPLVQYAFHQIKIRETLSEQAYEEIPFTYDKNNHFLVSCLINNAKKSLLIDTKATGLMREDSVLKLGGKYWGKLPIYTANAYGVKEKMELYRFDNIRIGGIEIKSPLFSSVKRSNLIYGVVEDGVFGSDLLTVGCWKFDTKSHTIKLFHYKNHRVFNTESKGHVRIKGGLEDDGITVHINDLKQDCLFTLDLGYAGTIEVDNKTADLLKKKYSNKQIYSIRENGMRDTITVFEDVPITVAGIDVITQVANIRSVNGNYIGAKFMQNFNFILMYGEEDGHKCKDLYLQKRVDDALNFRCEYNMSAYDMKVNKRDGRLVLTR